MIEGLIFDRSPYDLSYAVAILRKLSRGEALSDTEEADFSAGLRGCYNASDLNRVQVAMRTLSNELVYNGYYDAAVSVHGDWTETDVPVLFDWILYLRAAETIRSSFYVYPSTPPLPAANDGLNIEGANAIERNLHDISMLLDDLIAAYKKSGTFAAGEEYDL